MDLSEALFFHAPVGFVVTDMSGRITRTNPAFQQALGYSAEEARGLSLIDITHPEDREDEERRLRNLVASGTPYVAEKRCLHRDGRILWCDTRAAVVRRVEGMGDLLLVTVPDVTQRKLEELDIRAQRDSYEQMNQALPVAIALLDAAGTVQRVYPGFSLLFGYSEDEAVGQRIHSLIAPDERHPEVDRNLAAALEGETINMETVRRHKDGRQIHVSVLGRYFRLRGGEPGIFLVYRDITERKEAEALVQRLSAMDELTGLWNRRGFFNLAAQEIERARRQQMGLTLIFADLDSMKSINDRYGHQEGDSVLKEVAHILRDSCRGSDTVGRIGGDEFVMLAVGTTESEHVMPNRIRWALDKFNARSGRPYRVGLSMGTVYFHPDEAELDDMLALADRRM